MMVQTTHGLFLTYSQKLYLYINITCNQLFGLNPFLHKIKKSPLTWKANVLPMVVVPCLVATAHSLLSNPPHPFPTPSAHVMLQR
jgi:hypothetical protein